MNVSPAAELWGRLYGLLCRWETIRYGLASMPEHDQPRLDNEAEKIIAEFMSQQTSGA